jgi:single-strand DNA-binding protein
MGSVNKVILVGNLTRDPEMKQTEGKKPVCIIGLATNRNWTDEKGEKHEVPEYHRLLPGTNWRRHATSSFAKAGKSMLRADYSPTAIPGRTASKKLALK